ncbi:MAG: prenyltransferase [Planctomycetota bacterium]|nr:prenyltransferase [Planctomycetota bacterium]
MGSIFNALLGISRGPFLLLPVTLIASGAAAAAWDDPGSLSWPATVLALIGLLGLHIGVNALNEAGDMQSGIDLRTQRTPFSGGSGTLPAGRLTVPFARLWGFGATAIGLIVGVWFLVRLGWIILPLLLFGALAVLLYTPLWLRLGVGEVFAGLGLGALPVMGAALVQDGHLGSAAIAASIPAFFMTFNLLLLNEFPDEAADRAGGRRHLVILLGRRGAAGVYVAAVLAVPISIILAVLLRGLPPLALIAVLPTLLAVAALRWAATGPARPVPMAALGGNVAWNLATNALLAAALAFAAWRMAT